MRAIYQYREILVALACVLNSACVYLQCWQIRVHHELTVLLACRVFEPFILFSADFDSNDHSNLLACLLHQPELIVLQ